MNEPARSEAESGLLFELTLRPERGYWNDGQPGTSPDGRVGSYLASGQGTADGPRLEGSVNWDLFEDQDDETIHPSDMAGHIKTADGARIEFQSIGIFVPENGTKTRWRQTAAMRFHSGDERYAWLNGVLATMKGSFDYDTLTHKYQILGADAAS